MIGRRKLRRKLALLGALFVGAIGLCVFTPAYASTVLFTLGMGMAVYKRGWT